MEALYLYNYGPGGIITFNNENDFEGGDRVDGHFIYKAKNGTLKVKNFKYKNKKFVECFLKIHTFYSTGQIFDLTSKPFVLNIDNPPVVNG